MRRCGAEPGNVVDRRPARLCFLGLPWQHTRGSALLGWVQDDAEFIAERIRAFAAARIDRRG